MSEFKREERYIVIKLKQLDDVDIHNLRGYLEENSIGTTECVVVESDWPEYETVWKMIEDRSSRVYDINNVSVTLNGSNIHSLLEEQVMNYNNYNQFWLERLSYDAIQNGKNLFTKEEIQWALKQSAYEYFGDYEMNDNQRIAVSIMMQVCEDELVRIS